MFPSAQPRTGQEAAWLFVDELSHRVANDYALAVASLSREASRNPSPEARAALNAAAARLFRQAETHRALQPPVTPDIIDLSIYLQDLCASLVRTTLEEREIQLTFVDAPVALEAERCWRVGLVVSELVTNAVRHGDLACQGAIRVSVDLAENDQIRCRVADNGGCLGQPRPGRGWRIIDALAQELGGTIIRRFTTIGALVTLTFPRERR